MLGARRTRGDTVVIFNQFEEFGNAIWHYTMTGGDRRGGLRADPRARRAASPATSRPPARPAPSPRATTCGPSFPHLKVVATEALQCPTLLRNGFGAHRIEGIGDKHVPWIHNVRNTDMVAAIDDEQCMQPAAPLQRAGGRGLPRQAGRQGRRSSSSCPSSASRASATSSPRSRRRSTTSSTGATSSSLPLTDSMELYGSRIEELRQEDGAYTQERAAQHFGRYLEGTGIDDLRELGYWDRKALHNLKYFTWVEQQGKTSEELAQLWDPDFWTETFAQVDEWDKLITQFNERTGVLKSLA